ncbi:cell wall metabolism sensor histidine kinase WalK [Nakamurella sp. PAMC28650]|uniref:sensor histidine kinase n=1 Tax=Nakamurella sp. PAMC28650 TaxID=2762325 RepID=UPI00164DE746|nr:ATP-binding protein [Nakamurella sp. PAMC28650]QNK82539.1 PAS domain-containing protein [Nakamurella sp. PAMC28650]
MSGAGLLQRPAALTTGRPKQNDMVRHLHRLASDPNSVLERQLSIAVVFALSLSVLALPFSRGASSAGVLVAAVLMAASTAAAFVLHRPAYHWRTAAIVPLVDILAVGFLRAATGGPSSVFGIMLVLPVISLGVEPGRLPLLFGGIVTVGAMMLPLAFNSAAFAGGQWIRVFFTPIMLGLTCVFVSVLTRRLRSRVRAVEQLRGDQEILLAAAQDHADASASASALLRESANQLSSIIDGVTEQAIIATDPAGRIEMFNSGAQKMLRVAAHDVIGRSIIDLDWAREPAQSGDQPRTPSTAGRFAALVAGVRPGRPQLGDHTYQANGRPPMQIQVAITARRDAAGDIDGFLFVGTDVTVDREAAKMKDEFVNLISHELRTPLSSILGYLELIADDDDNPLSDEQLKYLATVDRNANRLLRLVSDLLFTAQVESGRFHLQKESVDLQALVVAALETATPGATARNVALRMSVPPEAVDVWGDPGRLGQAVDNLISNAVKFTPAGGRVVVTLGTTDEPEPRALIGVTDTGMGIPPDEVDRLFSRFFRASTATANAVPGVGLGLTITKAIASAHGGEIRVASTVGEGTIFVLDLPRMAKAPIPVPAS